MMVAEAVAMVVVKTCSVIEKQNGTCVQRHTKKKGTCQHLHRYSQMLLLTMHTSGSTRPAVSSGVDGKANLESGLRCIYYLQAWRDSLP